VVSQSVEVASSGHGDFSVLGHSDDKSLGHVCHEDIDGDIVEQQVNNIFNSDNPYEDWDNDILLVVLIASHQCIDGILE
jgi:hypothetical protein